MAVQKFIRGVGCSDGMVDSKQLFVDAVSEQYYVTSVTNSHIMIAVTPRISESTLVEDLEGLVPGVSVSVIDTGYLTDKQNNVEWRVQFEFDE